MKTLLTGIKPSGRPHLGNYIGAMRPALKKIKEAQNSFLFIADYHSLTSIHQPDALKTAVHQTACAWLACGLDPSKTILYRQSDIPELFELYWILSCLTPKGLMNRAHSYKAVLQENKNKQTKDLDSGVLMGLFNYPILMAADILLFQAEWVPTGKDQRQHLEMTRDIAAKFNKTFKSSLMKIPSAQEQGSSDFLPGIDGRKMSKSYDNHIPLFCSSKELKKKIMKIKTDSLAADAPKNPETSLIFSIYKAFASAQQSQAVKEKMREGISWGKLKTELFELLEQQLSPKRKLYDSLIVQTKKVNQILEEGAAKARRQAKKTIEQARKAIGITAV